MHAIQDRLVEVLQRIRNAEETYSRIPGSVALLAVRLFIASKSWLKAWAASAVVIVAATLFGVVGLYPYLLPSSLDPAAGLTVTNSSSSPLTLTIMLVVALTFVPIVIVYQAWVYHFFRGKITEEDLGYEEAY